MNIIINGEKYKTNTFGLLPVDLHAEYEALNRTATPANKARRLELERLAAPILAGRCIDCDEPAQVYAVNGKRIRVGCKC